jgi:hypothetical protein
VGLEPDHLEARRLGLALEPREIGEIGHRSVVMLERDPLERQAAKLLPARAERARSDPDVAREAARLSFDEVAEADPLLRQLGLAPAEAAVLGGRAAAFALETFALDLHDDELAERRAARIAALGEVVGVDEARRIVGAVGQNCVQEDASGLTPDPPIVLDAPPMGKFDRRNSQKMKRRKAQVKKKARLKAKRTASPATPAKAPKKTAAKKSAPPKSQAEPKA